MLLLKGTLLKNVYHPLTANCSVNGGCGDILHFLLHGVKKNPTQLMLTGGGTDPNLAQTPSKINT